MAGVARDERGSLRAMLSRVVGQDRVVARLRAAIARDRMPHAYLFAGPPGAPLGDTALALAAAVNCPVAPGEGCDHCDSCSKIVAGIHPDVVVLVREGAAQIVPIENVRAQVIARLGLPPHEGLVRVFIVEEATAMAPPAANALLKTLEEPPRRTLFVLCTTAPEQLLPTIRSRCQRLRFGAAAALPVDVDPASARRAVAALADELGERRGAPIGLPARIAETKGDAVPVIVVAAAHRLHARARAAAASGDAAAARRDARRAELVQSWQLAMSVHNVNAQLAIEALMVQLGARVAVNDGRRRRARGRRGRWMMAAGVRCAWWRRRRGRGERETDGGPTTAAADGGEPDAGSRTPEAGDRRPEAADRRPDAGDRSPEAADRSPEAADRRPEAGDRRPEAGDRRPEAGDRRPEAGRPQAGS